MGLCLLRLPWGHRLDKTSSLSCDGLSEHAGGIRVAGSEAKDFFGGPGVFLFDQVFEVVVEAFGLSGRELAILGGMNEPSGPLVGGFF